MDVLNIGLLSVPAGPLILFGSLFVAMLVARKVRHSSSLDIEKNVLQIFLAGVISARLYFVLSYREIYREEWWTIFDIRDGGFNETIGLVAAFISAMVFCERKSGLGKPLVISLMAGGLFWTLGTVTVIASGVKSTKLPELNLTRIEGDSVRLDAFIGKPLVINMWATWCPPCRHEMPVFQEAQQRNQDITFVFANQGESADQVRSFISMERLSLSNVLLDQGRQLGGAMKANAFPTTLFFDAQGNLVERRVGVLSEATLADRLVRIRAP